MKTILTTMAMWGCITVESYGQAVIAGSAEDLARRQQFADRMTESIQKYAENERRKAEEQAKVRAAYREIGLVLFGEPPRGGGEPSGTLDAKRPTDFKVGDWGSTSTLFQILNTVSANELLVTTPESEVMLIRGLSTSRAKIGLKFILPYSVVAVGTYRHKAPSGAEREVLVLERNESKLKQSIDVAEAARKALEDAQKAAEKAARDALYRKWTDSTGEFSVAARFITVNKEQVRLERKNDGKRIEIPVSRLSEQDQEWIQGEIKRLSSMRQNAIGAWRIGEAYKGRALYFTLTGSSARKSNAPDAIGKWEIVGDEVRITWSDGFRDGIRLTDGSGRTFAPGKDWDDGAPSRTFRAVKDPEVRNPASDARRKAPPQMMPTMVPGTPTPATSKRRK